MSETKQENRTLRVQRHAPADTTADGRSLLDLATPFEIRSPGVGAASTGRNVSARNVKIQPTVGFPPGGGWFRKDAAKKMGIK